MCTSTDCVSLGAGLGEAAAFGFDTPLLLGKCRVEVGPHSGLGRAGPRGRSLRLGNRLRAGARSRCRSSGTAVCRMHDRAALALGDFALDLFANLAGPLGTRPSRAFFVVKLGLGVPLAFVFARGFLLPASVQPVGEGRRHSDDELEVVENPVHRRERGPIERGGKRSAKCGKGDPARVAYCDSPVSSEMDLRMSVSAWTFSMR